VGSFLKITEVVAQNFGLLFSWLSLCIKIDKNGLGYILGIFFLNASGHPVAK
jgi:hypothetical protein